MANSKHRRTKRSRTPHLRTQSPLGGGESEGTVQHEGHTFKPHPTPKPPRKGVGAWANGINEVMREELDRLEREWDAAE